jgi:AcrR family transcriptional regulator
MPAAIDQQIIFNAALKVITERGYVGATTKLIAEEAGIGEVTLFRRFANKDNLILEALKQEAAKLDGVASLLHARAPLIMTFYTEITRHPELATVLEFPKRIIQKMLNMLERYQKEGKLIQKEPIHQLAELFGPVMMLMLFEVVYAGKAPLDIEEHVINFLKSNRPSRLEKK